MKVSSIPFKGLEQQKRIEAWLRTFPPEELQAFVRISGTAYREKFFPIIGTMEELSTRPHVQEALALSKDYPNIQKFCDIVMRLYDEPTRVYLQFQDAPGAIFLKARLRAIEEKLGDMGKAVREVFKANTKKTV